MASILNDRSISAEEATRVDVAACYRLIQVYGLADFTDGFVSARIASEPRHVVIGGYGMFPEFAKASALHRRCLDDEPQHEKKGGVDLDAIRFTITALGAREGVHACIHAHPNSTIALSGIDTELLPLSQWGIMYGGCVEYMDFTTTDVTSAECCTHMSKLFANGAQAIILRNHGVLCVGKSVAQAFFTLHRIELASQLQLAVMQAGGKMRMPPSGLADQLRNEYWTMTRVDNDGTREWPGLLAKLDLLDSAFRR